MSPEATLACSTGMAQLHDPQSPDAAVDQPEGSGLVSFIKTIPYWLRSWGS